jgi:hypothetical protein
MQMVIAFYPLILPGHGSSEGPAIKSIEGISEWIKKSMGRVKN